MNDTSASSGKSPGHFQLKKNVWPIFISYRRSEVTRKIAIWLKEELERETITDAAGQIFQLDVFVDAAEAHQSDFQANLVPHLEHSRALIVLTDNGAATKKPLAEVDYLYQELDWWANARKNTPPIILQMDTISACKIVEDPKFENWRKVNFMDCFWEKWETEPDEGEVEKARLARKTRESIRDYGQVIHLEEVQRLLELKQEAESLMHLATSRELTLLGEKFLPKDPILSLELAYHAANEARISGKPFPTDTSILLYRSLLASPRLLEGSGAHAVAWSPDDAKLVVASKDHGALIYDFETQHKLGALVGHKAWLEDAAWSPDGRFLATAARDGTARLWNASDYQLVETFSFGDVQVQTVSFHPHKPWLAIAHTAGSGNLPMKVHVWDINLHQEKFQLPGFRAAFSPDGTKIACGDGAGWGSVQVFDLNRKLLADFRGHTRYVHSLAWSPDNTRLATASVDDTVRVWDVSKRRLIHVLANKFALCVAWSPDNRYLASGGGERVVNLWDATSLADFDSISVVRSLSDEPIRGVSAEDYIVGIAWNPDGTFLAVSDRGGWHPTKKDVEICARIYSSSIFTARTVDDLITAATQRLSPPRSLAEVRDIIAAKPREPAGFEHKEWARSNNTLAPKTDSWAG